MRRLSKEELNPANKLKDLSRLLRSDRNCLVDARMPEIVANLQMRDVRAVVMTGISAAPFGDMRDPAGWRGSDLYDLGYRFGKSWPGLKARHMSGFFSTYDPYYSGEGVVLCGDIPKSSCLDAFLLYSGIKPKKIIFIDDSIYNLEDVQKYCQKQGIQFVGMEYLAAEKVMSDVEFSEDVARTQFKTLSKKGVWLSDAEAVKKTRLAKK
jgi:hypothetical protein